MEFTHKTTGNILRIMLTIAIILSALITITSFLYYTSYDLYYFLSSIDQGASILFIIIAVIITVLYIMWIYKMHQDLKLIDSQYPITPGGAIARLLIPFYNLYGIWNVHATLGNFFLEYTQCKLYAKTIRALLPVYYSLLIITTVLNRMVQDGAIFNEAVIMFSFLLDLILIISMLLMVNAVMSAFQAYKIRLEEEQIEYEDIVDTI